jgi:hypothetical protein
MAENYTVRLTLSEAMLNRVTLEKELARYKKEIDESISWGNAPDATVIGEYEALEKLIRKL